MTPLMEKCVLIISLAAAGWLWNGDIRQTLHGDLVSVAEAVAGAPATPVSYAGVARRTTVRQVTPGVGAPGVGVAPGVGAGGVGGPVSGVGVAPGVGAGGVGGPASGVGVAPGVGAGGVGGPASGVGVLPGAGAGQAGAGYSGGVGVNLGGPVNRVGAR